MFHWGRVNTLESCCIVIPCGVFVFAPSLLLGGAALARQLVKISAETPAKSL